MADIAPDRARVFMAEDNADDVTLMRIAVDEVGLAVDIEVASDGAQAVESLLDPAHRAPDLIILNFNLPKLQGHEVLSVIKRTPFLLGIPVGHVDELERATGPFGLRDRRRLLRQERRLGRIAAHRQAPEGLDRQQGAIGPQGFGRDPIAKLKLRKGPERTRVGEPLDEE